MEFLADVWGTHQCFAKKIGETTLFVTHGESCSKISIDAQGSISSSIVLELRSNQEEADTRSCSRTTTFDIFVQPRICQEMTSFRDVQNLCLLSHGFNFIDDMELLILYDMFEPRNPDFPYESYAEFDLDEMVESECLAEFRFKKRCVPTCRCSANSLDLTM